MMIRHTLFTVLSCILFSLTAYSTIHAHQGVPIDPSITEDSPREYSKLFLERKNLEWTELDEGIKVQRIRKGDGASPYKDAMLYVMWRMFDAETGEEIYYRTKHRTDNFYFQQDQAFAIGGGGALRAVELALKDMREGSKCLLYVSSEKAFGKEGWSDSHFVVPPNMDVAIELSLLWVRDPKPRRFTPGKPHLRPSPEEPTDGNETVEKKLPEEAKPSEENQPSMASKEKEEDKSIN